MTMMSIHPEGAIRTTERTPPNPTRPVRTLWTDHDAGLDEPPEQAFADIFGTADRVRLVLWIDRTAPAHGGLFSVDSCAAELGLPEPTIRAALGPLQHVRMVQYRGGLYMRHDHPLWAVLKTFRTFAGPALTRETPGTTSTAPADLGTPQDARAATFYFG